jgi:hypothetical protein
VAKREEEELHACAGDRGEAAALSLQSAQVSALIGVDALYGVSITLTLRNDVTAARWPPQVLVKSRTDSVRVLVRVIVQTELGLNRARMQSMKLILGRLEKISDKA